LLDLGIFGLFVLVLIWMILNFTTQDEELDLGLLIVRYVFQIVRFFVYVMKTTQKVKERKAIGEIDFDDEEINKNDFG